jgi:glycerol-3-phosphate dehydrogenase
LNRTDMLARLRARSAPWDLLIAGGGASGAGIALDAAARGYEVLLVEASDFGKGTSSRSTKLIHGGVRYLQQGNLSLVMEALRERGILRRIAPHVVHELPLVVPNYRWWEAGFYLAGFKLYDALAGRYGLERSRYLHAAEVAQWLPALDSAGLRGGVLYHDGQFDDARLLIDILRTAAAQGATVVNYLPLTALPARGIAQVRDAISGHEFEIRARCIVNATGAFADPVRRLANPAASPVVAASQGVHMVLPARFLGNGAGLLVPRTRDGRVIFALPWLGHTLVGTTDTPVATAQIEPAPLDHEIDFLLETAGRYLTPRPRREDILSVFAGIRPLVNAGGQVSTARLSREHTILVEESGLVTIVGGKWTTYRRMAQDCVDQAAQLAGLPPRDCRTETLPILPPDSASAGDDDPLLHGALPYRRSDLLRAVAAEMAVTLEDALARRTRALFLNAAAAMASATRAAEWMWPAEPERAAREVAAFGELARRYRCC